MITSEHVEAGKGGCVEETGGQGDQVEWEDEGVGGNGLAHEGDVGGGVRDWERVGGGIGVF